MENVSVNSTIITPYVLSTTDVIVGTTYIVNAVIFIFLHILCSYLIYTDKEMKNPTYAFMINLSIADCVALSMVGIYAGVVILTRYENQILKRIASFLCPTAWYTNCVLFVLIAFSRWIALTRPHMTDIIFRKNILWSLQAGSWLLLGVFCFYGSIYPPEPFSVFVPTFYTWLFDMNSEIGRIFSNWGHVTFDGICTVTEMSLNILSLIWVHQTRKSIGTVAATENKKREIKLLLQCFILGCVFTATYILFATAVTVLQLTSLAACLILQAMWTLNHSINPLVYLSVNSKLRKRFLACLSCGRFGLDKTKVNIVAVKSSGSAPAGNDEINQ